MWPQVVLHAENGLRLPLILGPWLACLCLYIGMLPATVIYAMLYHARPWTSILCPHSVQHRNYSPYCGMQTVMTIYSPDEAMFLNLS